jgi:plastocyanin
VTRAAALSLVLTLGMSTGAHAATKTVEMGVPLKSQPSFSALAVDVNDFFPHGVTIHAGDSVKFVANSFHTVDLPARSTRSPEARCRWRARSGSRPPAGTGSPA